MKSLFALLLSLLILSGCKTPEATPEFKSVYEVNLSGLGRKTTKLKALIAFTNPSENKNYTLASLMADIEIDGEDVGTFIYNNSLALKPKSEFKIPLSFGFDTDKILKAGDEPSASYGVRLKGFVLLLDESGEKIKITFDHTETTKPIVLREERKEERIDKRNEKKMLRDARKLDKSIERLEKKQQ
jgi:LEA14-like dessication related protein